MTEENGEKFSLRLELRVKSARLVQAREKLGLTATKAAKKIGLPYGAYLDFESMRRYPSPEIQTKICKFYSKAGTFMLEEEIFPRELMSAKAKRKYIATTEIPKEKLISLCDPTIKRISYNPKEDFLVNEGIEKALKTLTEKEQEVIKLRFGLIGKKEGHTLGEIGEMMGFCYERIRQIESKAMRKLKDPSRLKYLYR